MSYSEEEIRVIREVVGELCADEREQLGKNVMERLIRGDGKVMRLDIGDTWDPLAATAIVTAMVNLTVAALKLRDEWKHSHPTLEQPLPGQKEQMQLAVGEALDQMQGETKITVEQRDRIITIVLSDKRP